MSKRLHVNVKQDRIQAIDYTPRSNYNNYIYYQLKVNQRK